MLKLNNLSLYKSNQRDRLVSLLLWIIVVLLIYSLVDKVYFWYEADKVVVKENDKLGTEYYALKQEYETEISDWEMIKKVLNDSGSVFKEKYPSNELLTYDDYEGRFSIKFPSTYLVVFPRLEVTSDVPVTDPFSLIRILPRETQFGYSCTFTRYGDGYRGANVNELEIENRGVSKVEILRSVQQKWPEVLRLPEGRVLEEHIKLQEVDWGNEYDIYHYYTYPEIGGTYSNWVVSNGRTTITATTDHAGNSADELEKTRDNEDIVKILKTLELK